MITLRLYGLIFGLVLVAVIVFFITLSTETCVRVPIPDTTVCGLPTPHGEDVLKCNQQTTTVCTNMWHSLFGYDVISEEEARQYGHSEFHKAQSEYYKDYVSSP